jgi:hypothetical protein
MWIAGGGLRPWRPMSRLQGPRSPERDPTTVRHSHPSSNSRADLVECQPRGRAVSVEVTRVSDARTAMSGKEEWGVRRAKVAFQPTEGGLRDERTAKRGVRTAVQRGIRCGARRQQVECRPIAREVSADRR